MFGEPAEALEPIDEPEQQPIGEGPPEAIRRDPKVIEAYFGR